MSTYSPQELLKLWKQQELPVEMTTGHILQNLVFMQDALDAFKRELIQLRDTKSDTTTSSSEGNSTTTKQRKLHKR